MTEHIVNVVIHGEAYIGRSNVESAAAACHSINSTIQVVEHREALRTSNALEIVSKYDLVIDATDNPPSRYLISDCCVLLGKPLVSGAASGLEGQGGPCYRCLFPTPPPTTACKRCFDNGVLGVVATMNSDSHDESATVGCFCVHQVIAAFFLVYYAMLLCSFDVSDYLLHCLQVVILRVLHKSAE
ncbi:adenylyltransferase and sulfurtransferase [Tanacetum coccineum]